MTIYLGLSEQEIESVISNLKTMRDNLKIGVHEAINALTVEGAEVAQAAYGSWGVEVTPQTDETYGEIIVYGDMPLIAEFGAGDTTFDPLSMFENAPAVDVFPGSYSLYEGTQEYYKTGKWHFAGKEYHYVYPHMGLYKAKQFIINNSTMVAKEVIQL